MIKKLNIFFIVFALSCSNENTQHHIDTKGYNFNYCKEWSVVEELEKTIIFSSKKESDDFVENVNVIFQDLNTPITLEQYCDLNINEIEGLIGYDIDSNEELIINDLKYARLRYKMPYSLSHESDLIIDQFIRINNQTVIIITYTSKEIFYEDNMDCVMLIVNSFEW